MLTAGVVLRLLSQKRAEAMGAVVQDLKAKVERIMQGEWQARSRARARVA